MQAQETSCLAQTYPPLLYFNPPSRGNIRPSEVRVQSSGNFYGVALDDHLNETREPNLGEVSVFPLQFVHGFWVNYATSDKAICRGVSVKRGPHIVFRRPVRWVFT
jgi:hypothetical protein